MNKVCMMGRLTRDVELRYGGTNNVAVANFTLAVNRRFKQEGQTDADFINCVAFGKTGEFVGKYFNKGLQVAVEGRIQTRTYDNAEGKKVYVTEVVAESVYFADSKKDTINGLLPHEVDDDELPF
jgi:single-strand DNA-binding protein